MSTTISTQSYAALLNDVRERIRAAQLQALRTVNRELIGLYWDVGRMIVDRQKDEGWGRSVVERLARDLQAELPGVHGFSTSNLWRMRGFYRTYADSPNLAPLVREIGWSHNLVILERCPSPGGAAVALAYRAGSVRFHSHDNLVFNVSCIAEDSR